MCTPSVLQKFNNSMNIQWNYLNFELTCKYNFFFVVRSNINICITMKCTRWIFLCFSSTIYDSELGWRDQFE